MVNSGGCHVLNKDTSTIIYIAPQRENYCSPFEKLVVFPSLV